MPTYRAPFREPAAPAAGRDAQGGFTLLEVMFGLVLLALGLLAHVSSTVAHHNLEGQIISRVPAEQVLRQFVERLRADEDFGGLYTRLHAKLVLAGQGGGEQHRLRDGRKAWPVQDYYPTFTPGSNVKALGVLVEVPPRAVNPAEPTEPVALREDLVLPRYALPADLNGDGVIDSESREDDYRMLPVVVILRWEDAQGPQETRCSTWIGGAR